MKRAFIVAIRHPVVTGLGMVLLAVALFFILFALATFVLEWTNWFGTFQKATSENGRQTIERLRLSSLIVAGIVLLVQLWLTNRRVGAAESTAKAAVQVAESTVNNNISQRFKEAVELLGHESEIVRAGGIEALMFIARDNPDYRRAIARIVDDYNRYHWPMPE